MAYLPSRREGLFHCQTSINKTADNRINSDTGGDKFIELGPYVQGCIMPNS
jgi:hypothetical protein